MMGRSNGKARPGGIGPERERERKGGVGETGGQAMFPAGSRG